MKKTNPGDQPQLLVLCQLFYPELVSTGQTLTELCEELAEQGMNIEVFCAPPTVIKRREKIPKNIKYKGIKIRRVWGTRLPKLNLTGRILNQGTFALSVFFWLLIHRPKKPILVLTNPPFLAASCALLRKLKLIGSYIYLIFDVYPDTAIRLGVIKKNGLLSGLWDCLNGFILKNTSAVIVIGRCMKEVIAEKMKKICCNENDKIYNITMWSDDKLIKAAKGKDNPLIKKWNLENKFVVCYSGNMGRFHDMETVIRSAEILKTNEHICFLFVGEGHKKQDIIKYATEYNLQNCQFHTYVTRQKLGFLMNLADVGIVSLLESQEGLSVPSKAFGLMAAGVPIIAVMSAKSEISRIVTEENCGLVTKPGNEKTLATNILRLYNNKNELEQMGKNSLNAINEKHNLENVSKQYFDLITEISPAKTR